MRSQLSRHFICLLPLVVATQSVCAEPLAEAASAAAIETATPVESSGSALPADAEIGTITIQNGSVFDLEDPAEDRALYRFMNRAHYTTRPDVIKAQLLFESGDPFSPQKLEESERLLRANRYLQDASISPVIRDDGAVDINVRTSDVWTLMPKLNLSRSGGKNRSSFGIKEMNLLGTGMAVELQYKSDFDRDTASLKLVDHNVGNTRYSIEAYIAENSDGYERSLQFGKPFYSLDSRAAKGIAFRDRDQVESFYDRGEKISDYRHEAREFELSKGWSGGLRDGWTRRISAGFAVDEHRFSDAPGGTEAATLIPEDRALNYPFVDIEWLQDKFEKTSNIEQINRTEDRFLGARLNARLGLASSATGSDRDAWIFRAVAQKGFGSSATTSLLLRAGVDGRLEDDGLQDLSVNLGARYFRRQSERRLLYVGVEGTFGRRLDLDNTLLLGGDNGLRGYPLRYQSGDKAALLTVEQRFFSNWYPFHLVHVGAAVFFDAGRVWGESPVSTRKNEWLRDVGVGLRLGNSRSGFGRMAHIDVAFPLDGDNTISDLQFIVSTQKSF